MKPFFAEQSYVASHESEEAYRQKVLRDRINHMRSRSNERLPPSTSTKNTDETGKDKENAATGPTTSTTTSTTTNTNTNTTTTTVIPATAAHVKTEDELELERTQAAKCKRPRLSF
jgi:hypothetical protein